MKRAPIVLAGTALGLGGVLGYHTTSGTNAQATGSATTGTQPASTTGGSSTSSTSSAASTTAPAATGSSTSTTSSQKRSATGEDVSFQYGDLQVKVTVSGRRVTDVSVVSLEVSDPRSQSIDQSALPELRQEAISAQSGQIDGVSGASYTSQAYEQSLQSALDKLGVSSSSA
jgi:uncharacterized protein with FMN-binding domain